MQPYVQLGDNFGNFLTDRGCEVVQVNGIFYGVSTMEVTATRTGSYYVNVQDFEADQNFGGYTLAINEVSTGGNELETWTTAEVAFRLTDSGWAFFNGTRRSWDQDTITYDVSAISADAGKLAKHAFDSWSKITGLTFQDAASTGGTANIVFDDEDPGTAYANSELKASGSILRATINVAKDWEASFGATLDSYLFQTYIHEIGHALGLAHAGDYNAGTGQPTTYPDSVLYLNDSWKTTIMSYIDQSVNTNDNADYALIMTAMNADIYAIQDLYGVPAKAYDGNTRYGVNSTTGDYMDLVFDALAEGDFSSGLISGTKTLSFTLWDTGGKDTIDFRTDKTRQTIDLRPESQSDIYGTKGSMVIGRDTIIEKYIAGSKGDSITGNGARNVLDGRNGNDVIKGGAGNDKLLGGRGKDKLSGEAGNDTLKGQGGNDLFIFAKNGGRDTIKDFTDNKDTLQLDDQLWKGNLTVQQVINKFGSTQSGDAVFTFDNGEKVIVQDINLNVLGNDINIV
jgi:serralysin